MQKEERDGYIAGAISLLFALYFGFVLNSSGWTVKGQELSFVLLFGFSVLGAGSILKPTSIGSITSEIFRNMAKNARENVNSTAAQIQKDVKSSQQIIGDHNTINIGEKREMKKQKKKRGKLYFTSVPSGKSGYWDKN